MKKWFAFASAFALLFVALGSFAETNYENPVTAAPPLVRPNTKSCVVTLADNYAFNQFYNPDMQAYAPPADCPGPWSKVILDWTGSVAGHQFDRIGAVWLGQAELLRTSTPEPSPAGITWHAEKDVTEYSSLLSQPQTSVVDVPNIVNSTYTGVIYVTVTLTFYEADSQFPAAAQPDSVFTIGNGPPTPWFSLQSPTDAASATLSLPSNIERAYLEVYATPHICDEFWYANAPTSFAGSCGGGTAFRELQVFIDGQLAGVAWPFPVIYTGGINPLLWRPIPGVNAFNIPPYRIDLTPFAGILTNGQPHTISVQVYNSSYFWLVDADLLLFQDGNSQTTSGELTVDNVSANPTENVNQNVNTTGALFNTTANRSLTFSGYVNTSAGKVTTTVQQNFSFTNGQVWNLIDFLENLSGTETIATTTTVNSGGHIQATQVTDSYPISVTSMFQVPEQGNKNFFTLPATVDQELQRTTSQSLDGTTTFTSWLQDHVHAAAILREGSNLVTGGATNENYVYTDSTGVCFNHTLSASQGYVTASTYKRVCP